MFTWSMVSRSYSTSPPLVVLRVLESAVQVVADLLQSWAGVRSHGEEVASDAGVFVGAAGAVGADAAAEFDLAFAEVLSELGFSALVKPGGAAIDVRERLRTWVVSGFAWWLADDRPRLVVADDHGFLGRFGRPYLHEVVLLRVFRTVGPDVRVEVRGAAAR